MGIDESGHQQRGAVVVDNFAIGLGTKQFVHRPDGPDRVVESDGTIRDDALGGQKCGRVENGHEIAP